MNGAFAEAGWWASIGGVVLLVLSLLRAWGGATYDFERGLKRAANAFTVIVLMALAFWWRWRFSSPGSYQWFPLAVIAVACLAALALFVYGVGECWIEEADGMFLYVAAVFKIGAGLALYLWLFPLYGSAPSVYDRLGFCVLTVALGSLWLAISGAGSLLLLLVIDLPRKLAGSGAGITTTGSLERMGELTPLPKLVDLPNLTTLPLLRAGKSLSVWRGNK